MIAYFFAVGLTSLFFFSLYLSFFSFLFLFLFVMYKGV